MINNYNLVEAFDSSIHDIIKYNILNNSFYKNKISTELKTKYFFIYDKKINKNLNIIFYIETNSSIFFVEHLNYVDDNNDLYNKIFLYSGLDKFDLNNYYLSGKYLYLKGYKF